MGQAGVLHWAFRRYGEAVGAAPLFFLLIPTLFPLLFAR